MSQLTDDSKGAFAEELWVILPRLPNSDTDNPIAGYNGDRDFHSISHPQS
jgi:hypothetical protein